MVLPWMEKGRVSDYIEKLQDEGSFADGRARVDQWVCIFGIVLYTANHGDQIWQIAQGLESLHEEDVIHGDLRAVRARDPLLHLFSVMN